MISLKVLVKFTADFLFDFRSLGRVVLARFSLRPKSFWLFLNCLILEKKLWWLGGLLSRVWLVFGFFEEDLINKELCLGSCANFSS